MFLDALVVGDVVNARSLIISSVRADRKVGCFSVIICSSCSHLMNVVFNDSPGLYSLVLFQIKAGIKI